MKIKIDREFQKLIPPPSAEELQRLEASILADGCRDALVVWAGHDGVLLDGHNRLAICEKLGKTFTTIELELPSRDAARDWIVRNQLGRRNLTNAARIELALLLEPRIRAEARDRQRGGKGGDLLVAKAPQAKTRDQVAAIAGVGVKAVDKVKQYQERGVPELAAAARAGDISIHAAAALATLPAEEQREVVRGGKAAVVARVRELRGDAASAPPPFAGTPLGRRLLSTIGKLSAECSKRQKNIDRSRVCTLSKLLDGLAGEIRGAGIERGRV